MMIDMAREKYYKWLFLVAALWNVVGGLLLIVLPLITDSVYGTFGMAIPTFKLWDIIAACMIIIFGLGYFLVSGKLDQNRAVVFLGGLSKIVFFILGTVYLIQGSVNWVFYLVVIFPDLVFTGFFIEFIIYSMKE